MVFSSYNQTDERRIKEQTEIQTKNTPDKQDSKSDVWEKVLFLGIDIQKLTFYNMVHMNDETRGIQKMEYADTGSKYTNRPNLLRVATELTRCKNPDKALDVMQLALKGGVDDLANSQKDLSLSVS